jgi:hypothetical protein
MGRWAPLFSIGCIFLMLGCQARQPEEDAQAEPPDWVSNLREVSDRLREAEDREREAADQLREAAAQVREVATQLREERETKALEREAEILAEQYRAEAVSRAKIFGTILLLTGDWASAVPGIQEIELKARSALVTRAYEQQVRQQIELQHLIESKKREMANPLVKLSRVYREEGLDEEFVRAAITHERLQARDERERHREFRLDEQYKRDRSSIALGENLGRISKKEADYLYKAILRRARQRDEMRELDGANKRADNDMINYLRRLSTPDRPSIPAPATRRNILYFTPKELEDARIEASRNSSP